MKIRSFDVYILDLPTIRPHQLADAYNCFAISCRWMRDR